MNRNANVLPAGYKLPELFEGIKPLDVEHVVNEEGVDESTYRTLCKGGVYKNIPMSAMVKVEAPADAGEVK